MLCSPEGKWPLPHCVHSVCTLWYGLAISIFYYYYPLRKNPGLPPPPKKKTPVPILLNDDPVKMDGHLSISLSP